MKLTESDISQRLEYLEEVETITGLTLEMADRVSDTGTFELFMYDVQKTVLEQRGISADDMPPTANARKHHFVRMQRLFDTCFMGEQVDPEKLFEDCDNVRDKIAKLTSLKEAELMCVADDLDVELVVRKYAKAIINGVVDDLHKILDQSLGKPPERSYSVHQELRPLQELSIAELKQLAAGGGVIEATAEVVDVEEES